MRGLPQKKKGIAFQYDASGGNAKQGNPTVYFKNDNVLVRFKDFVIECPCAGLRQPKAFATVILYANAQGLGFQSNVQEQHDNREDQTT